MGPFKRMICLDCCASSLQMRAMLDGRSVGWQPFRRQWGGGPICCCIVRVQTRKVRPLTTFVRIMMLVTICMRCFSIPPQCRTLPLTLIDPPACLLLPFIILVVVVVVLTRKPRMQQEILRFLLGSLPNLQEFFLQQM